MAIGHPYIDRGSTMKLRTVTHRSFKLTNAGAAGTPANSLLLSGRAGFRIVLCHIGFSNGDASSNNIALQWTDASGNPVDPDVSMVTVFARESLPDVGVTLRNLIGMEVASGANEDLHGWLADASTGWYVNLGYLYIPVPS